MLEITSVKIHELDDVIELEKKIDYDNSATKETIFSRYNMFPKGFLVAKLDNKIVGYVESCLWNKENFETFKEIKNFPEHHNEKGKNLYVIFLAVDENYRKQGIGSKLIQKLEGFAWENYFNKIQLASREELFDFYGNLGFKEIRRLPNFLDYAKDISLMEKLIK